MADDGVRPDRQGKTTGQQTVTGFSGRGVHMRRFGFIVQQEEGNVIVIEAVPDQGDDPAKEGVEVQNVRGHSGNFGRRFDLRGSSPYLLNQAHLLKMVGQVLRHRLQNCPLLFSPVTGVQPLEIQAPNDLSPK